MATTRPAIPPANLKERIAALEQRNAANTTTRPTSPTAGAASIIGSSVPSAAGFRDKIAKFEKKGGVPVPRGRFGLGAPPTSEGPRKQGELYGNRIPAPARHVSAGMLPATSSTGSASTVNYPGTSPVLADRRSFSLSSINGDFDGQDEYSPISSPTFAYPLNSPESLASIAFTPDGSPTVSPAGDVASFNRHILRGTSFQKALDIARNSESAKQEARDPATAMPDLNSFDFERGQEAEPSEQTPVILLSSEGTVPVVLHSSPVVESKFPSFVADAPEEASIAISAPVPISIELTSQAPEISTLVEERTDDEITVVEFSSYTEHARISASPSYEDIEAYAESSPASGGIQPEDPSSPVHPHNVAPYPTVIVHAPASPKSAGGNFRTDEVATADFEEVSKPTGPGVDASIPVVPQFSEPATEASEIAMQVETPKIPALRELPPPQIVVHQDYAPLSVQEPIEQSSDDFSTNAPIASNKAPLTLESDFMNEDSFMSPLSSGDISATTLADALTNYFTPGPGAETGDRTFRTITPPPPPTPSPLSPIATLAYDAPDATSDLTIDVPDLSSFLSPPVTGAISEAALSGGSSIGSSLSMSMIEMSPSHVSRAMRMTPATSRGVPHFLPPNSAAHTRKSDFIYFPPTPEAKAEEFGSASLHKSSQSLSFGGSSNKRGSEIPLADPLTRSATFNAVVHGKVREPPVSAPVEKKRHVPETPQMKKVKRMTMMEPPLSPGQGELAALLQEAALLEYSLDRGELPSEHVVQMAEEQRRRKEDTLAAAAKVAKEREEEQNRIAAANARPQTKRDEPTSGRLKHTFLIPLSRARTTHRKEVSASHTETFPTKPQEHPILLPKSAGPPEKSAARIAREGLDAQALRPATPENSSATHLAPQTPPKSPKPRFGSFRRLGSITRPNTIHSGSTRHSQSTSSEISSEDSVPVVTPPESTLEFGAARTSLASEFGHLTNGSTTSFPSLSPKTSSNSIGRAASFAEKMWSRARTKSSGSNLSTRSEAPDDIPSLPTPVVHLPAIQLPHLPNIPAPPLPPSKNNVLYPPQRSTSLKHPMHLPPLPTEPLPPLPVISSSAFFPTNASETSSDSLMLPSSSNSTRPSSWTSMSSAGSLPSPLFDEAFFNAFPSVPETTIVIPAVATHNISRNPSILATVNERPSFDSAFLSSAIHLASTHKSANATVPPTTLNSSRAPTPTPSMSRRSGESRR